MNSDDLALAQLAARNNAEWCDMVCRTHGITGTFHSDAWASSQRTLPLYPDAVALDPALAARRVLSYVDGSRGCFIKDSFRVIDLTVAGFNVLLEAQWFYRSPATTPKPQSAGLRWRKVSDESTLAEWEVAWATEIGLVGTVLPAILAVPSVVIVGGYLGDRLVAGAILNGSKSAVGLSNVFTTIGDLQQAFASCVAAASQHFPGLPIVGYERGDSLLAARAQGFRTVGALAVWVNNTDSTGST